MDIKKDCKCMFLRIPSFYRNLDVIEEHLDIFRKHKELWIMKMGKKPDQDYLEEVIKNNGGLIIKKASKFGNQFYFAKLESISPNNKLIYPEYYNEIFKNMNKKLEDTFEDSVWFKVTEIYKLTMDDVGTFVTKKGTSLYEAATHLYQVSYMYVNAKHSIKLKEVV